MSNKIIIPVIESKRYQRPKNYNSNEFIVKNKKEDKSIENNVKKEGN